MKQLEIANINRLFLFFFNKDALSVICIFGVETEGLAPYQYAPKCKDCMGKDNCKDYESRPKEW